MPTLSREHRRLLENTVADARRIAVAGAEQALRHLGVHEPEWRTENKALREQLRAHGRQLGDKREPNRSQQIACLAQACAYEHWHRMLFARFLAENDLLLDPEHAMAMTLAEVRDLAREQGRDWMDVAAEIAQRMLLAVFRPDDPVLSVSLPPETRQQLEEKLAALPAEIFRADDSLGWVYQFWQRDEKDRVNKSEVKIGADELPAVTQLFTEDYMVLFLLENTLGAWWTAKRRAEGKDPALPGYEWTYLRLNQDGSPAAGGFDGWPRVARDLRVLDPCMGSGHFLVFTLSILARMRAEEEGLSLQDSLAAVLRDNLFGLEIDARCSQIAAFNLALAAWRLAGGHFPLPEMNLACSGLGIHASESDWVRLAGEDALACEEMRRLYSLFKDAPTLGSLIDPLRLRATVYTAGAQRVLPLIEEALQREQSDETRELAIAAQGVLAAFRMLASNFTLVATNVPYLGRGKQHLILGQYCAEFHSDAKADLATSFVDRCLRFSRDGGSVALVTPQNWLFLTSYQKLRERLLLDVEWDLVVKLGANAFQDMNWWAATTALVLLTARSPRPAAHSAAIDVSGQKEPEEKATSVALKPLVTFRQEEQLRNPNSVVSFESPSLLPELREFSDAPNGSHGGDSLRHRRVFWEMPRSSPDWRFFQGTVEFTQPYGGREHLFSWFRDGKEHYGNPQAYIKGENVIGRPGVVVSMMRTLPATLYSGELFDISCTPIVPRDPRLVPAIWSYCSSEEYRSAVRRLDQKVNVTNATLAKVPFDLAHWQRVGAEVYPNGLPKPHSDNPTQWLFNGHPKGSDYPLQVAVARLVGYRWPRQTGSCFPDCPALGADGLEPHTDADGIVALSSLSGEASAADRLRGLLADGYGAAWSAAKLAELVGDCESLEIWLRERFFETHCQIFHDRPFVWHIWDGRKDGFHALVNYHKLAGPNGEGLKTLEKLIYTLLGDWITRQRAEVASGVEGADARLTAGLHLKAELEKILAGEKPYDIFVRWKPLHEQPLGWEPDINDGVRLNIRPWLTARPYQPSRRDASILRVTPRINYGKDRGKEPHRAKDDFPWFWNWDERTEDFHGGGDFDGARWNDLHYSLAAKQKARERKQAAEAKR